MSNPKTQPESTDIILAIETKGEVVSSNFTEFTYHVRSHLQTINRDLKTDDEFDQADSDAKRIAGAENSLKAAKAKALADAEQLNELFSQIDSLTGDLSAARLDLQKQIAKRKEEIRSELIEEYLATFDIDPRDARRQFLAGLQAIIKGKRTVESMRTALRVYSVTSQAIICKSRDVIRVFKDAHGGDLVSDSRELELQKPDAVEAELRRRFEARKAEIERKRLEAEAATARAEADKAKEALAEASKPPSPPVTMSGGVSERIAPAVSVAPLPSTAPWKEDAVLTDKPDRDGREEWSRFAQLLIAAFSPVKAARAELQHPANIAKAQEFAMTLGSAWKAANTKDVAP